MELSQFSLNDLITITIIIAQAGIVYYRLKKVEQKTEQFNSLLIEFAVHKTSLKHHKYEFDKQTSRIENVIQRLDDRLSGIEIHAYEALLKNSRRQDQS
jgi:division protein CdvB (Snf7/Vps24/ESCRT-III family)